MRRKGKWSGNAEKGKIVRKIRRRINGIRGVGVGIRLVDRCRSSPRRLCPLDTLRLPAFGFLLCACRPYPWGCAKNDFFGMPARVGNLGVCGVLLSVASTWGGAILAYAAALCTVVFQTVVLLGCFARLSRLKMTLVLLWLAFWLCATGALIVVIALLPSSLHQIIANGVATVLIVLFLLASRKGFVVPGICGEVTLTIALRNLFCPWGCSWCSSPFFS